MENRFFIIVQLFFLFTGAYSQSLDQMTPVKLIVAGKEFPPNEIGLLFCDTTNSGSHITVPIILSDRVWKYNFGSFRSGQNLHLAIKQRSLAYFFAQVPSDTLLKVNEIVYEVNKIRFRRTELINLSSSRKHYLFEMRMYIESGGEKYFVLVNCSLNPLLFPLNNREMTRALRRQRPIKREEIVPYGRTATGKLID